MKHDSLFIMNKEGELEINKPEAVKTPEYAVLFKRDIGSSGDSQGRKKLVACAEMYYIYLVYDFRSKYHNLDKQTRKEKARKDAQLPPNWREDKELNDAAITYVEDLKLSASGKAYIIAEKGYHATVSSTEKMLEEVISLKRLIESKTSVLSKRKAITLGETEIGDLSRQFIAMGKELVELESKIMKNIGEFKPLSLKVSDLYAVFAEEGGSLKVIIGSGGPLGNRED